LVIVEVRGHGGDGVIVFVVTPGEPLLVVELGRREGRGGTG